MPQMKPMNWLILFFYFLISFIFMNNNLYFFNYKNFLMNPNLMKKNHKIYMFKW